MVVLLALGCTLACGGDDKPKTKEIPASQSTKPSGEVCGVEPEHLPGQASAHVAIGQAVPYVDAPPTGGTHSQCWADWGVYEEELADELWVHNLEHGGVVLLYNCPDGCPDEVAQLEEFANDHDRVILSPYAALPTRFGATAWEFRLLTDCFDSTAIEQFYEQRFNKGRENIMGGPPDVCRGDFAPVPKSN